MATLKEKGGSDIFLSPDFRLLPFVRQARVWEVLRTFRQMMGEEVVGGRRTIKELNLLVPQVQEFAQEHMDGLRLLKKDGGFFSTAAREAETRVSTAAREAVGQTVRQAVWAMAGGVISPPEIWDKFWAADCAAVWETIEHRPGFENNPFLPLLALHHLEAGVQTGFREVNGVEALVVDFPFRLKGEEVLACLAFPDGGPGDKEVLYYHSRRENCREIRPLYPQRTIR